MAVRDSKQVVLAMMAHPDDAEFLCAGTLIRLREAGWEIHIASATPGDCGTTTENRWDISSRRTQEAAKAASILKATYHCLDERDCFIVYEKVALQKAFDLFRQVNPTLVFTHAPRDYVVDHEQISLIARAASFIFSAPNISTIPFPRKSVIPYLYYCDPLEAKDSFGQPVTPTTYVDISKEIKCKTKMLSCHESQRQWLLVHHGMDEYLDSMQRHSHMRGKEIGVKAAEAFIQHLGHAYPQDDILKKLFRKS